MVWQCVVCSSKSEGHCPNCAHRVYCSDACMQRDMHSCSVDVKLDSLTGLKPASVSRSIRAFQRLGLGVVKWVLLSHAMVDSKGEMRLPPVFQWIDSYDRFALFSKLARDYRKVGTVLYEVLEHNAMEPPPFDVLRVSPYARFLEDEINAAVRSVAEASIAPGIPFYPSTSAAASRYQTFIFERRIVRLDPSVKDIVLMLLERVALFAIFIRTQVTLRNINERAVQNGVLEGAVRCVGAFVEFGTTLTSLL